MHLQCPHCHNPIEVVEEQPQAVVCPSCGSSIQLDPQSTRAWLPTEAPRRLGKFEFLEQLGVGAFGTVFKARDTELDRTVAVKIPRAGSLPSPEDLDRFLREARSAAQLTHPGIVALYDAGQLDGTCYLVSEFIQGATLTERLSAGRMSFRQSAELVAEVSEALAYAHRHGVIHRDMKPSNIMLDLDGRPHVMDFGLAKRAADEVTMTLDGQVLGTPAYMSPEQARGETRRVDARSDVYSLGVILYELLTGELPFRGQTRMLLVQVMHDEPRPPRRLNDRIPRDLETICLKCMQKEPGRRYASAQELADDLHRHLKGEPIRARPVGAFTRGWRWCRRNPAVAGLLASLLVAVVGLAVATGLLADANERERRAKEVSEKQREIAQSNFKLALSAVDTYFTQVSANPQLKAQNLERLRQQLLQTAKEFYEKFVAERSADPELQAELGRAYYRLALLTDAIDAKAKVMEWYEQSRAIFEELLREHPNNTDYQKQLARVLNGLGNVYMDTGQFSKAEGTHQQSLQISEELARRFPEDANYGDGMAASHNNLGLMYRKLGQNAKAEGAYREAVRLREEVVQKRPDDGDYQSGLARSLNNLANLHADLGENTKAEEAYVRAVKIRQELVSRYPDKPDYRDALAGANINLGAFYFSKGRPADGEARYLQARDTLVQLVRAHPDVLRYRSVLGTCLYNLGRLYANTGQPAKAEPLLEQALAVRETLVKNSPEVVEYQQSLASTYGILGSLYRRAGQVEKAEEAQKRTLALRQRLAREHPKTAELQDDLAQSHINLGNLYLQMHKLHEAEAAYRSASAIVEKLVMENPRVAHYQNTLAVAYGGLGTVYLAMELPAKAEPAHRQAIDLHEKLAQAHPEILDYRFYLGESYWDFGTLLRESGKPQEALASYGRAITTLEGVLQKNAKHSQARDFLGSAHVSRARTYRLLEKYAEALADFDCAIELADPKQRVERRLQRAAVLASSGDHELAVREVEATLASATLDGDAWYAAAGAYAVAATTASRDAKLPETERRKRAEDYAGRALEMLTKARAGGLFKNPAHVHELHTDKDLDPLRQREDFQKLVKELKENTKAKP